MRLKPAEKPWDAMSHSLQSRSTSYLSRILGATRRLVPRTWHVLRHAYLRFLAHRATEAAAGMAFYALFALFPLLIFVVGFGSSVLQGGEVRAQVVHLVTQMFPASQELVLQNLNHVLATRGAVSLFAALSLLWSSSGFFGILARQINDIWPRALLRSALERRILALALAGGLAGLVILWSAFTSRMLPYFGLPAWERWLGAAPQLKGLISLAVAWVMPFAFSIALYRFVPKTDVRWAEAMWGALLVTGGWKGATSGFLWYLGSGWATYHLVYGSLASVIVLMFWLYLVSAITLFGAHLSAAAARHHDGAGDVARRQSRT